MVLSPLLGQFACGLARQEAHEIAESDLGGSTRVALRLILGRRG